MSGEGQDSMVVEKMTDLGRVRKIKINRNA